MENYGDLLVGICIFAILPGFIAKAKGRSFWGYYFLGLIFSPLLSFIVIIFLKSLTPDKVNFSSDSPVTVVVQSSNSDVAKYTQADYKPSSDSSSSPSVKNEQDFILIGETAEDTAALAKGNRFKCSKCGYYSFTAFNKCSNCYAKGSVVAINYKKTLRTPSTSFKEEEEDTIAIEIKKYKNLFENDLITKEEFEAKKKQLLGL